MKKLWLVSLEVMAENAVEAAKNPKGKVYSVMMAGPEYQPESKIKIGFDKKDDQKRT